METALGRPARDPRRDALRPAAHASRAPRPSPSRCAAIGSEDVAQALAERAVFVSNGDFYATTVVRRLGHARGRRRARRLRLLHDARRGRPAGRRASRRSRAMRPPLAPLSSRLSPSLGRLLAQAAATPQRDAPACARGPSGRTSRRWTTPRADAYQKPDERPDRPSDLRPGRGRGRHRRRAPATSRCASPGLSGETGRVYAVDVSPDMIARTSTAGSATPASATCVTILSDPDDPAAARTPSVDRFVIVRHLAPHRRPRRSTSAS